MSLLTFAHNGIDHTNQLEAAAHQSNSLLWIALIAVAMTLVFYKVRKRLDRQPEEAEEEEDL